MEHVRRFIFALSIFAIATFGFLKWRAGQQGYGLSDLLQGTAPPADSGFTTPAKPALDLNDTKLLSQMSDEFANLSAAVLPAVVSITAETVVPGRSGWHPFFGMVRERSQRVPSLGSGAIISKEGHVITNFHVINRASSIFVTTSDNQKLPVTVLGASEERDVALLKIQSDRKDFPALTFANSDVSRVGQIVFAVGNPFGLSGTVTQGIISARDRHLSDSSLDYLQTDTVINPGNSGGPLVDVRGQILGINVAIYQGDENVTSWQGVGLAIPANDAKRVVEAILELPKPKPGSSNSTKSVMGSGYLGLELNSEPLDLGGINSSQTGALVTAIVRGSPAQLAGLQPGDIITQFNGESFRSPNDFLAMIRMHDAGETVTIDIIRNRQALQLQATLGARPDGG
ncbi:MAG: trypsin-like peptidase domain-containing protein [Verrucomicrobiales bacterium]|nr:trypsin-like peptidase domain-containing protein [Verrucomicrobiales bacterium]MCP5560665.1 trypsin-like peptidase domain-containing protein [Verrucomicrobiaceae bacterium]